MAYLEELLPEFRKGAKIRQKHWEDSQYIFIHTNGNIYLATGRLFKFDTDHLLSDGWEFYQEPIEWDYIIKNRCLCWFWDGSGEFKVLGVLIHVNENSTLCRYDCRKSNGDLCQYANCRPVRRDEVTFYEDRKDE